MVHPQWNSRLGVIDAGLTWVDIIPSTFSLSDPESAQRSRIVLVARTPSTVVRVCFSYRITIHSLHGWNPIYIKYGKIFKISSWRASSLWFMGVCIDNPMLWHEGYWNSISAWVVFNGSGQYSVPLNGFKCSTCVSLEDVTNPKNPPSVNQRCNPHPTWSCPRSPATSPHDASPQAEISPRSNGPSMASELPNGRIGEKNP